MKIRHKINERGINMTLFQELTQRGLIAQTTDEEKIKALLDGESIPFYIGFDATADSLHVGHFLQILVMMHMQKAGHKPIVLLGTGTTMVGDPTGKTDMRKMLTAEQIDVNAQLFHDQIAKFIDFSDDKAICVKNGDWLRNVKYIDFLRNVGVHFSVNKMLTAECFKSRLEKGLSFIEFNYMLMQSYDFLHLYNEYNCRLQLGGDDQWSNIINGTDLIRRVTKKQNQAYGMTFTLLTTKEGKKMGKTEKGALWLNPEKTPPYEFYQYFRNVGDEDVINCLKMLTFLPLPEIAEYERLSGSELNAAKERLAYEITSIVHSKLDADKAREAAVSLFGASNSAAGSDGEVPQSVLADTDFVDGRIEILDLLVKTGLAPSKTEARRLIQQGGILADDKKVKDFKLCFTKEKLKDGGIMLKKGKKVWKKAKYS